MRVVSKQQCLLFVFTIIFSTFILSASAGPTKDKKKLLEKLRNALNQTELEEAGNVTLEEVQLQAENNVTVAIAQEEEAPEAKTQPEEEASEKSEDDSEQKGEKGEDKKSEEKEEKEDKEKSETSVSTEVKSEGPAAYLLKMKSLLKRVFDLFGFRQSKKKEGRQNRMLANDDSYSYNGIEYEYFQDDIRTTVGAVLGERECIQKIVCGAGSYLRDVNGKHVILRILDHVTPSAWMDTVELLKKSAVTDGDCQYKCLEEDDEELLH